MSTRASIITAIDARFKTIAKSNGYNTNIGAAVYHFSPDNIPEDTCPALVYSDVADTEELEAYDEIRHDLTVVIDLKYAVSDIDDVYSGIEDVLEAIGVDPSFGGLANGVVPQSNELDVSGEGQTIIVTAKINVGITYLTGVFGL
jgi:hypothetical protein